MQKSANALCNIVKFNDNEKLKCDFLNYRQKVIIAQKMKSYIFQKRVKVAPKLITIPLRAVSFVVIYFTSARAHGIV